jgi:signal transduction histidine kinase
MKIAPFIPLAGCFLNAFFAFFVFTRNPRAVPNRIYLAIGLFIAEWNLGQYFMFVVEDHDSALFWTRFLHFGLIIGVVAFFHLMLIIANYSVGRWIRWLYASASLIALTDLTPLFIEGAKNLHESGWYAVAGPLYFTFPLLLSLMFAGTFVLLRRRRQLPRLQGRRLTPLIWAQFILTLLGVNDILPIIGIDFYPVIGARVFPWGSLAAVFYGIIAAYSVLQYQLLDFRTTLSHVVARFIRFAFLFSIGAALLIAVASITRSIPPTALALSIAVFCVSAVIAAALFPRLFGGTGFEMWERRMLGDHFEYQDRVAAFIRNLPYHSNLATLLSELHELFTGIFRFDRYFIILRHETDRVFTIARSQPEAMQHQQVSELKVPSPVFTFFERDQPGQLAIGEDYRRVNASQIERQAADQLSRFDTQFAFPLLGDTLLFGLVLVGRKPDGEPFTSTDLQLLTDLAQQLSLVVNQILLKDEVLRAQELELLGRMSRGMAHDLNNLLTPMWTLLQLAHGGMSNEALDEDLIEVALRNLKLVRAYIKEALFFSENLRPDLQIVSLNTLVEQVAETSRKNTRKEISIVTKTSGETLVEIDEVLIQRMLANLISNAVDASPVGGEIQVEIERLVKTESARDWLRLRVVDQGEGIPRENLDRVSKPYFTTKNRGDEGRGFGLGLAIARKIIALHGGHLNIFSQSRKGTTVQIDLPSRQLKPAMPEVANAA